MQNPNSDPTKIVLPSARLVNYCAMPSGLLRRKSRSHAVPGFASFQHQLRAASTTRELLDAMDALETMLCATGSDAERIQLYKADIEAAVEVRLSRCDARAPARTTPMRVARAPSPARERGCAFLGGGRDGL